jgi:phosphoesterase RecJ-like protein
MIKSVDYQAIVEMVREAKRFLLTSHNNPDGDGMGSALALALALESAGKTAVVYNRDGMPANLGFLPSSARVVTKLDQSYECDLAVMLDCAQRKRISDEFAAYGGARQFVCIDHHALVDAEADVSLVDCQAASTGEVVLHIIEALGLAVTPDIAQCIYTTFVVDTGFFKYSNTNAHVLEVAAKMVGAGAEPWLVAKSIEESHPASRLKLLAMSLATLRLEADGRYASMDVTQDMLKKSGADMSLSDEFATYPRTIDGVEVAALFREVEKGLIKVSIRSKDVVDVALIARGFGGGGHGHAAGFRMRCGMKEAKKRLLDEVEKALKS